jgi:hypothetical protein
MVGLGAVFLDLGLVSAQLQGFQTFAFAEASPKSKNPRSPLLHHFCQCSYGDKHPAEVSSI